MWSLETQKEIAHRYLKVKGINLVLELHDFQFLTIVFSFLAYQKHQVDILQQEVQLKK